MESQQLRHRAPGARAEAFTLIEVLLAVMLMSIIITVMYGTFHTLGRIMLRNEQTKGAYQSARLIMDRLRRDLMCAQFSPRQNNFVFRGEDIPGGEMSDGVDRGADALTFVTMAHIISRRDAAEGDLAEISYYLDDYNPGILVRREDVSPDDELEMGGSLEILGKKVAGLNFTYLEGTTDSAQQSRGNVSEQQQAAELESAWKPEWDFEETPYLPRAVRVDLSLENEEGGIEDFTATITLAMGRTATSVQPTIPQAPRQRGTRGGPTPGGRQPGGLQPTGLQPGRRGGRGGEGGETGRGDFGPGGRGGERGTGDFGRGTRGGQSGGGMRPYSPGSGTRTPGTPTIPRNIPNAGSGTMPPTPGGRR